MNTYAKQDLIRTARRMLDEIDMRLASGEMEVRDMLAATATMRSLSEMLKSIAND